jgi:hypothetical protein
MIDVVPLGSGRLEDKACKASTTLCPVSEKLSRAICSIDFAQQIRITPRFSSHLLRRYPTRSASFTASSFNSC